MKQRITYDEKGRVKTKAITSTSSLSRSNYKYTYTYKGDTDELIRVNKTVGKISQLVYQVDSQGRVIYEFDEDKGIGTEKIYNTKPSSYIEELIHDKIDNFAGEIPEVVETSYGIEDNVKTDLFGVTVKYKADFVYQYKFLPEAYKNAGIDRIDFVPDIVYHHIDSVVYTFILSAQNLCCIKKYNSGDLKIYEKSDDNTESYELEIFYDIEKDKRNTEISAMYYNSKMYNFIASETKFDPDHPYIPMVNNAYRREIIYNKSGAVSYNIDTSIKDNEDGTATQTITFSCNNNDPAYNYTIYNTMDQDGNVIHVENTLFGEVTDFDYNDQGLIIRQESRIVKKEPKKILYKGAIPTQPQKDQKSIQQWHYTDDGRLLMKTSHNDLMCTFEVHEYDDEGREIFNADFSSLDN